MNVDKAEWSQEDKANAAQHRASHDQQFGIDIALAQLAPDRSGQGIGDAIDDEYQTGGEGAQARKVRLQNKCQKQNRSKIQKILEQSKAKMDRLKFRLNTFPEGSHLLKLSQMRLQSGGIEADEVQRGNNGHHVVDNAAVRDEATHVGLLVVDRVVEQRLLFRGRHQTLDDETASQEEGTQRQKGIGKAANLIQSAAWWREN